MRPVSRNRSMSQSLRIALVAALVILGVYDAILPQAVLACPGPDGPTYPGTEAYASTITLQMPFIAGETWTVGGAGSFYGNVEHCNNPNNDYYATDWNRTNDDGANVLPVADGAVSDIRDTPCPPQIGYGCFVQIDHANGYRTLYAHLSDVLVAQDETVHTWTLIGRVGDTGVPVGEGSHLHLTFRHDDGGYFSYCWNNGQTCPNGETPQWPQGHRPSPMMTASGATILEDFQSYTSVNGRIYLPDLRNNDNGWTTEFYVRNDGTESRFVTIRYFNENGTPTPRVFDRHVLSPNQWRWIPVNEFNRIPAGTTGSAYIDGGEAVSVVVVNYHLSSPYTAGSYLGLSQASSSLYVPLLYLNNSNWQSDFVVFDATTGSTQVTVQYIAAPGGGTGCTTAPVTIPAYGSYNFSQRNNPGCALSSPFIGGARVTNSSGKPLAAIAHQELDSNNDGIPESFMDYEAFSAGRTPNYLSLLMRNNSNWQTGVALQDTSGGAGTVTINYYRSGGCSTTSSSSHALGSNAVVAMPRIPADGVCVPAGAQFVGAGRATRSSAFVAVVNQVNDASGNRNTMSYSASGGGTSKVIAPLVLKNVTNWGRSGWSTGLSIQNVGSANATVTLSIYNASGSLVTTSSSSVAPYNVWIVYPLPVADGFSGSARITANQPIAVVVNHATPTSGSDDTSMSHMGMNR